MCADSTRRREDFHSQPPRKKYCLDWEKDCFSLKIFSYIARACVYVCVRMNAFLRHMSCIYQHIWFLFYRIYHRLRDLSAFRNKKGRRGPYEILSVRPHICAVDLILYINIFTRSTDGSSISGRTTRKAPLRPPKKKAQTHKWTLSVSIDLTIFLRDLRPRLLWKIYICMSV